MELQIEDRPGMLARVATIIGEAGGNILEVSHNRMLAGTPAKSTTLGLVIEARDAARMPAKSGSGWWQVVSRSWTRLGRELKPLCAVNPSLTACSGLARRLLFCACPNRGVSCRERQRNLQECW